MGFGFVMVFWLGIAPLLLFTCISLIAGRKSLVRFVLFTWIALAGLIGLAIVWRWCHEKKDLDREDIYGNYVVDRSRYSGKQADWQYEHFRFEITRQQQLIFIQSEGEKVLKKTAVDIQFLDAYRQPRISLMPGSPRHHIIAEDPALYRTVWGFYYVFYSRAFGNVFFKKGNWEPL